MLKKSGKKVEPARKPTDLELLCEGDREVYDLLFPVMLLDPRKVEVSIKQAADNARKSEKDKDLAAARMWYEVAGGLALYEGNVKKVIEYYGGAGKITGQEYSILKNPEKALAKAREYYAKYLLS